MRTYRTRLFVLLTVKFDAFQFADHVVVKLMEYWMYQGWGLFKQLSISSSIWRIIRKLCKVVKMRFLRRKSASLCSLLLICKGVSYRNIGDHQKSCRSIGDHQNPGRKHVLEALTEP